MIDGKVSEQIGVNPMFRMRTARVRLGVDRLEAHQAHQPLDALAVEFLALAPEMSDHPAAAEKRGL
jgi:hypothetical protein